MKLPPYCCNENVFFSDECLTFVYKKIYPELITYVNKFVNNIQESEDIVQETFIKAINHRDRILVKNLKSYLFVIAHNIVRNTSNRHTNLFSTSESLEKLEVIWVENANTELKEIVREKVNLLPKREKEVLHCQLNGMRNQEIAINCNLSINTIKTHKKRAYKTLKLELADFY